MNATRRDLIMQRWNVIQHERLPELRNDVGTRTPKREKVIPILEWVRIEAFVPSTGCREGRPPHERSWLANAFVAKSVLGLSTTRGLIERLTIDRAQRRIGGFSSCRKRPSESPFSRAFDAFAEACLAERVHETLVKDPLGSERIGPIRRDGTAIESRERPVQSKTTAAEPAPTPAKRRGRPRRGDVRLPAKESPIHRQRQQTLAPMMKDISTACDRGTKCKAQEYKVSWNGYKRHLDTADGGVPIAAVRSSASRHDSLASIPLSLIRAQRVTNLYDLMDAAYCSTELRAHRRRLGHVPLIDHNPRRGEKIEFAPAEAVRDNERTAAERSHGRLKEEFGGHTIMVKGVAKVMGYLMFGGLALTADPLMRLRQGRLSTSRFQYLCRRSCRGSLA